MRQCSTGHTHASSAGIFGGLLFENHVVVNGKRTSRRALLALAKLCARENRLCVPAEAAEIVVDERVSFFSTVLSALHCRGRSAYRQLFFFTLLAQARGLSRTGMEFFNSLNVCLAPRTFDLELATFMNSVAESHL